ncbi:hypothetical protein Scep_017606 [Stephania cephalantha]|uniref:Uncharacterized protein n=1 Tax=Stephania cephalantha TaxID=152367 RepID=A0AAP0NUD8_9MAGN
MCPGNVACTTLIAPSQKALSVYMSTSTCPRGPTWTYYTDSAFCEGANRGEGGSNPWRERPRREEEGGDDVARESGGGAYARRRRRRGGAAGSPEQGAAALSSSSGSGTWRKNKRFRHRRRDLRRRQRRKEERRQWPYRHRPAVEWKEEITQLRRRRPAARDGATEDDAVQQLAVMVSVAAHPSATRAGRSRTSGSGGGG